MLKIQKFDHQTIEDRRILFFDGLLIKLNTNAFLESKLIYAPKNEKLYNSVTYQNAHTV